jgi:hypothetical protein
MRRNSAGRGAKETADKQAALVMTTVARDKNPTWKPHMITQNTKQNKLHVELKRTGT